MRRWGALIATLIALVVLVSATACTRSKLGAAPSPVVVAQATAQAQTTSGPETAKTVVSADATATATKTSAQAVDTTATTGAGQTPIPTITPTSEPGATATPTTEPGATAAPTNTPSPTLEPEATPTEDGEFEYTVTTGDTLWGLAMRFGTTVQEIKTRNSLSSDIIYKGDKLIIPTSGEGGDGERITHVVQAGENLFRIALKYGTTVGALASLNNIINPSYVYVGQELQVIQGASSPGGTTAVRYHVVQPGETLWSIAMRYGTTPWKIAAANGISNINFIYAGRTLRIP